MMSASSVRHDFVGDDRRLGTKANAVAKVRRRIEQHFVLQRDVVLSRLHPHRAELLSRLLHVAHANAVDVGRHRRQRMRRAVAALEAWSHRP